MTHGRAMSLLAATSRSPGLRATPAPSSQASCLRRCRERGPTAAPTSTTPSPGVQPRFLPLRRVDPALAQAAGPAATRLSGSKIQIRAAVSPCIAARFFRIQPATVVAVTGTNGKTSVVRFVRHIWYVLGFSGATIGTLGVSSEHLNQRGNLTTPDPVNLHRALAELAGRGIDHLAMEASSHGLSQYRLDGVRIAAGRVHQSDPRSSRLSRQQRGLSRCQVAAFRGSANRRMAAP